jgi:outer membrane lipoprotein-sorting protein
MKRTSLLFSVCCTLVSFLSFSAAQAMGDEELIQLVRDAHRAARESIQTFSGRVEFALTMYDKQGSKPSLKHSCSSQFWLSPRAMRAKISENNENTDSLWDNSVRRSVIRTEIGGQPAAAAARDAFMHRHGTRCDPFVRGLLVFNPPNTSDFVPFEELLERATKLKKVERKQVGDKELILVQLFFDKSKKSDASISVDIYFDSGVNYLVRHVTYNFLDSNYRWDDEVLEFKEHKPSLFFPERMTGSSQLLTNKAKGYDSTTRFSDVQINQPLPGDIFNFKYPHGVSLRDNIRGSEYRVDADGNPISQQIPYVHEPPPPGSAGDVPIPGTETQEEPQSATRWILPISLGILIVGGVAAFRRRRRTQAESR